jgi:hypothetical protein
MTNANRHTPLLDSIAKDLRRWHAHRTEIGTLAEPIYTRDLISASESLENLVEDIEDAYVRLTIGATAVLGVRVESAPMQSLYVSSREAVPYSVIALDHAMQLRSYEHGKRMFERHFGNRAIYFSARQLGAALDNGASLTIDDNANKPDYWSFERPTDVATPRV